MKKLAYPLIIMVIMLSLVLSACTRSATKGGGGGDVVADTPDIPFPVGPTNNPNRITEIIAVTQTAGAQTSGDSGQAVSTEASTEGNQPAQDVPTATPQIVQEETPKSLPTNTPFVISTATPGLPTTYTLQEGEFLYCIARRFNIDPNDLLSANNLTGLVPPGTTLTIPSDSTWPTDFPRSLISHPTTYTVGSGDSIYSIACEFGDVDPNEIIAANNLAEPYTLTFGQTINIP